MNEKPPYRFPSMIICEGPEDVILFQTIARHLGRVNLHIEHTGRSRRMAGGNTKFDKKLLSLRPARGFEKVSHLLIVADSDDDPEDSFSKIRTQIDSAGFGPAPAGQFQRAGSRPSVTIAMVPPGGGVGDLEAMCAVAAKSAHASMASKVDHAMALLESPTWAESRRRKAWLRVFLAAAHEKDPFVPLGTAVEDQGLGALVPIGHACFERLRDAVANLP